MFILGNLFAGLAHVLAVVLNLYIWVVLISVILTWVNADAFNPIVRIIRSMTEPAFGFIRRRLPFSVFGGLDWSPFVLMLIIIFAQRFLVGSLIDLSRVLR